MRVMIVTAAALLAACASPSTLEPVPQMTVAMPDLEFYTAADRAILRERVATAASQFCAAHNEEITPIESRTDPAYCPDMIRSEIMRGMTAKTRKAYELARREAGVRGRNL
jgi:UrcA family protein